MAWDEQAVRRAVEQASTVVVKVGSSSLTDSSGHLDSRRLSALVGVLSRTVAMGARVVLVSSGAIAAGFGPLGFDARPEDVPTQQAAASVGQGLLMARYEREFSRYGVTVGQILLTAHDTIHSSQYRNAQRTLRRLLDLGVVPIVNENDALASNEIRFGDNDRLSSLGQYRACRCSRAATRRRRALYSSSSNLKLNGYSSSPTSRRRSNVVVSGSNPTWVRRMTTKLEAVRVAAVLDPFHPHQCYDGRPALMGTPWDRLRAPQAQVVVETPLDWVRCRTRASLLVDAGAKAAILGGKASLLAAGSCAQRASFQRETPCSLPIQTVCGAKGLVAFDSERFRRWPDARRRLRADLVRDMDTPSCTATTSLSSKSGASSRVRYKVVVWLNQ